MTDNHDRVTQLRRLLSGTQLPALPQSAIRVIELAKDPDNGPAEYAVPIEAEPGLASQVLRFVNSSYFGFAREISSVKLAITLVGIRTIKNFVLWSAVYSTLPNPRVRQLDVARLWQDSLRRGLFARTLGKAIGVRDIEELFAAALLQDMALPLLARELPVEYARLFAARQGGAVRLSSLERAEFGWTHADAAHQIASLWNLPPELALLVQRHVDLERITESGAMEREQLVVTISSLLPASVDETWTEQAQFDQVYGDGCAPKAPTAPELFALVDGQFQEIAPTLKLGMNSRPLADYYREVPSGVC